MTVETSTWSDVALIGLDWGSTNLRAYAFAANGEVIDTGRLKVGSVFGDHARTGLGVLLDAGTVVGPFAAVAVTVPAPAARLLLGRVEGMVEALS